MKKADLYLRARGDISNPKYCIVQQEKLLTEYCAIHQLAIREKIYDYGSACTFERSGWSEYYERLQSSAAKPDVILFTSWDRFSRNFEALLTVKANLNRMGITVMPIDDMESFADALKIYGPRNDNFARIIIANQFF
ncbi:recombinase family protein [Chitinophaga varians]|uniref:Recombinase family protein n=1 Tax=Chitinophaga varians TaxID=2202339 RepID=A0A847RNF6_9BACT|nr:recombinase family protein [Chitinophaga varians]NLR67280.1 recombinase family protein [Chitinophaga varians]